MRIALMFPGQGAQYVGMGRELYEQYPEVRRLFAEAEEALELPLAELCFNGPEERLEATEITQPAILTVSIAALVALEAELGRPLRPVVAGGLSLGEYTALVATGALPFAVAVRLVRLRGRLMQEAVPPGVGAMAAVLGLDAPAVEQACREAERDGEIVEPANYNCPGQVVIAGHATAVERALERARAAGAKRAVRLPVSAPFHCRLMAPARERFAPVLADTELSPPRCPVVANVDGVPRTRPEAITAALVEQIDHPVRWEQCLASMRAMGVDLWLEVGPGTSLTGFLRRIDRQALHSHVEDPASLARTLNLLQAAAAESGRSG